MQSTTQIEAGPFAALWRLRQRQLEQAKLALHTAEAQLDTVRAQRHKDRQALQASTTALAAQQRRDRHRLHQPIQVNDLIATAAHTDALWRRLQLSRQAFAGSTQQYKQKLNVVRAVADRLALAQAQVKAVASQHARWQTRIQQQQARQQQDACEEHYLRHHVMSGS